MLWKRFVFETTNAEKPRSKKVRRVTERHGESLRKHDASAHQKVPRHGEATARDRPGEWTLLGGLDWVGSTLRWLRGVDLNHRPLGYEPNELPDCSTPQSHGSVAVGAGQIFSPIFPLSAFESHVGRS